MYVPILWISFIFSLTIYILMKMFYAIGSKTMTVEKANMFNYFLIPSYIVPISMIIITLIFKCNIVKIINLIFAILMGLVIINDFFGDIKRKSLKTQTAIALIFTFIVTLILIYYSIIW